MGHLPRPANDLGTVNVTLFSDVPGCRLIRGKGANSSHCTCRNQPSPCGTLSTWKRSEAAALNASVGVEATTGPVEVHTKAVNS